MDKIEFEEMARQMLEGKSDSMDFVITREKREPGKTVSKEALDSLKGAVSAFITARVMHHWDAKPNGSADVGPSVIRAEVKITIDDIHVEPEPDKRPWFILDGNVRLDA